MKPKGVESIPPRKWLNDYNCVSKWMKKFGDMEKRVEENGGLMFFDNFLPDHVAKFAFEVVKTLKSWDDNAADRDNSNNVDHRFKSTKYGKDDLISLIRVCEQACPGSLSSLSAGRYGSGDFIEIHDDRAYTNVFMNDTQENVLCSRRMAFVLYLTPNWQREWGGLFVDHEDGLDGEEEGEGEEGEGEGEGEGEEEEGRSKYYVPKFNSAVCFSVPRYHEVTPVTIPNKYRYSIFGWFLEEGILYDLQIPKEEGDEGEEGEERKEGKEAEEGEEGEEEKEEKEEKKAKEKGKGKEKKGKKGREEGKQEEVEVLPIIPRRLKRRKLMRVER